MGCVLSSANKQYVRLCWICFWDQRFWQWEILMRRIVCVAILLLLPLAAKAQCPLPVSSGQVWTAATWNTCLSYLYNNVSTGGGTVSGSNFNSTFPTTGIAIGVTNGGNMVSLAADSFSDLYVNLKTAIPAGTNVIGGVTQSGNWVTSITGTVPLPNGAAVASYQGGFYNSTVPTLTNGQQIGLQTDINGNLKVNVVSGGGGGGGGGSSSAFGSAFPLTGTAIGATSGGNMVAVAADGSNNLNVDLKTALPVGANVIGGVTQSGTWTISLPSGAATAANQTAVQGSASGGGAATTSQLGGGIYNSSAPTLSSGQQASLQLDAAGNLRVDTVSSAFTATFPATGFAMGAYNGGNMVYVGADNSHNLNVNCTVGCSGGTASNASSGVAVTSTNGTTNAWMYAYNGTTWDQLQDDGSKNLKVNLATAIPVGSNVIGAVTESGTWNITNVSGTVSLPTGASTAANQTSVIGTVAAGTAAGNSLLTGAVYNSTQPTPTTGQQTGLQADPHGNLRTAVGSLTLVALDASSVTTGGTAVSALTAGHRTGGGWIFNPSGAAASLCINEIGTASGTVSSGSTTCVAAGQSYTLAPSANAVSVIASDSGHAFSGEGFQ
jgi:hypothetical protein